MPLPSRSPAVWIGQLPEEKLGLLASKVLANDAIEQVIVGPLPFDRLLEACNALAAALQVHAQRLGLLLQLKHIAWLAGGDRWSGRNRIPSGLVGVINLETAPIRIAQPAA